MDASTLYYNINKGVIEEKFHAFKTNLEKNSEYIRRYGGIKHVIPRFNGKNIIIAGAGSSLENELDTLRRYQFRENIIIVSTDMALLPLVKKRILPHFVISCETTPSDYFCGINTEKIHLLAFSCMSNTNLRKWKGNVSFYNWMIHNEIYDALWEKAGMDLGFVATGSIVTSQAVSIVMGCGIKSLMLVGNDMGFGSEYYARETAVYKRNINIINRIKSLDTIEINIINLKKEYKIKRGDKNYFTNNQFLAAKMWLEDFFKKINMPVYDSGEPGCSPEYVQKQSLKKYFDHIEIVEEKPDTTITLINEKKYIVKESKEELINKAIEYYRMTSSRENLFK
jgi:flagellar protein FlbD